MAYKNQDVKRPSELPRSKGLHEFFIKDGCCDKCRYDVSFFHFNDVKDELTHKMICGYCEDTSSRSHIIDLINKCDCCNKDELIDFLKSSEFKLQLDSYRSLIHLRKVLLSFSKEDNDFYSEDRYNEDLIEYESSILEYNSKYMSH